MQKTIIFLFSLITLFLLANCQKSEIFVNGLEEIDLGSCIEFSDYHYVIDSEENYLNLLTDLRTDSADCKTYLLPPIDFSEKTLIGFFTKGVGCTIFYTREVLLAPEREAYIYKVVVNQQGSCRDPFPEMNWITVPKLPENYEVIFDVSYH